VVKTLHGSDRSLLNCTVVRCLQSLQKTWQYSPAGQGSEASRRYRDKKLQFRLNAVLPPMGRQQYVARKLLPISRTGSNQKSFNRHSSRKLAPASLRLQVCCKACQLLSPIGQRQDRLLREPTKGCSATLCRSTQGRSLAARCCAARLPPRWQPLALRKGMTTVQDDSYAAHSPSPEPCNFMRPSALLTGPRR